MGASRIKAPRRLRRRQTSREKRVPDPTLPPPLEIAKKDFAKTQKQKKVLPRMHAPGASAGTPRAPLCGRRRPRPAFDSIREGWVRVTHTTNVGVALRARQLDFVLSFVFYFKTSGFRPTQLKVRGPCNPTHPNFGKLRICKSQLLRWFSPPTLNSNSQFELLKVCKSREVLVKAQKSAFYT